MANTGLGEGHEKTATGAGAYQNDGLRDTDVLSSPSLTNFVERGLRNGVIPTTPNLNDYNHADRNNPMSGNCHVRPNGSIGATKEFYVDAGTVCLDGMFYTVGSASVIDITATAQYHTAYHAGPTAIANGSAAADEAILLVYVDPRLPNNVGLTYGTYVNTASGIYPSSPSGHLVRQTVILAAMRIGKGGSGFPVIQAIEDKRAFIRPGPIPLTSLIDKDSATDHDNLRNDHISGLNAANLPITDMGALFARDPNGFILDTPDGVGQTHLFYQSDVALGAASGGVYQITPVHKVSRVIIPWAAPLTLTFGVAAPAGLRYHPLLCTENGSAPYLNSYLVEVRAFGAAPPSCVSRRLNDITEFTVSPTQLTVLTDPAGSGIATATHVEITYVHAGH